MYLSAIFLYVIIYIKRKDMSMRDINRINSICDKLKEAWKLAPDQHLGQLCITSEDFLLS